MTIKATLLQLMYSMIGYLTQLSVAVWQLQQQMKFLLFQTGQVAQHLGMYSYL